MSQSLAGDKQFINKIKSIELIGGDINKLTVGKARLYIYNQMFFNKVY